MEKGFEQWCPEYVTTGFIAGCCGVSKVTALRWIKKGHLPAFRLPDKHYRISRKDFIEFLTKHGIPVPHDMSGNENTGKRTINRKTRG